jgi:hypothetical protein
MGVYLDLKGTTQTVFQLGKGGPKFQDTGGDFHFHTPNLVDYTDIFANVLHATGNELVLNANASNSGSNRKYTVKRPTTGMTQALTLHLPPNYGSAGQFLQSDGAGNTSWASAGGGGGGIVYRGFGIGGIVSTGTNVALPLLIRGAGTILSVKAYVRTAPSGGAIDLDVKKNGVSIFSALPQIADGANLSSTGTLATTAVAVDDILELDVTAAVSNAYNLTLTIKIQE